MLKLVLFFVGILTFFGLVWHIGPARIAETVGHLGPAALAFVLLPSLVMYSLEAWGWRLTLGTHAHAVPFWKLLAIRTAGEVVNMTTPSAYVGGEPLKAYLLKREGVPIVEGLASVVTAKTTMTIAEILFILLGLACWVFGASDRAAAGSPDGSASFVAVLLSVGLLVSGTAAFVVVQRRGLFAGLLGLLRRCGIRIGFLESREHKLHELDRLILQFYSGNTRGFVLSTGACFLGWLAEAMEVYVMLLCLGGPVDVPRALAIAALSVFIKGGAFFIPGSIGAQEAGNVLLLVAYGYSEVTGLAFALLRRFRELVWICIGLLCLALMGWPKPESPAGIAP